MGFGLSAGRDAVGGAAFRTAARSLDGRVDLAAAGDQVHGVEGGKGGREGEERKGEGVEWWEEG